MVRAGAPGVVLAVLLAIPATASTPVPLLQQRLQGAQSSESRLSGAIGSDSRQIQAFQGRIDDLRQRLAGLESSLAIEQRLLEASKGELRAARARLQQLRVQFASDQQVLARQLVAQYKADRPDVVTVIMDAHGFADLLERMDAIRAVGRQDTQVVGHVRAARAAVTGQAARLARLTARRQEIAKATLVQTQEVEQLKSTFVEQQLQVVRARTQKSAQLAAVRSRRQALESQLASIQAQAASTAVSAVPTGSFQAGGGPWGFFPAAGTNYSVNEEPQLAARLDQLGKALHLHLIGISGYRTPQHSVEVGGFANDPHTQGRASDTPGVEGVPEATLNRFGLTRPFPGAAEADHIQLLGG